MNYAFGLVAALSLTANSYGQEFIAVNIGPEPDALARFDIKNPAASISVGNVAADFTRGMVLDGPLDGYYIATHEFAGPITGLFCLDNGVSTKIGEMPFLTNSAGGMAFSADGSHLWVVLARPNEVASRLYKVTFTGAWREIGMVEVIGSETSIIGIATDPITGQLYGLERISNFLIDIDTTTGQGTNIGSGLGINMMFIGGLDFTPDGQLYMVHAGDVYPVWKNLGIAGKKTGTLGFNSSSLMALPESSCYADCDRSTGLGVFDIFDFLCFQDAFVNGEAYACKCDTSTGVNVCDIFDFLCFQNAFVAGCS